MTADVATAPAPDLTLREGTEVVTVGSLEEGAVIERLEKAFRQVMETAMAAGEKGSLTLTLGIVPDKKSDEDEWDFTSSVKMNLPAVKGSEPRTRGTANHAYTDIKTVNQVLRQIEGGQFEDIVTGEVVEA